MISKPIIYSILFMSSLMDYFLLVDVVMNFAIIVELNGKRKKQRVLVHFGTRIVFGWRIAIRKRMKKRKKMRIIMIPMIMRITYSKD